MPDLYYLRAEVIVRRLQASPAKFSSAEPHRFTCVIFTRKILQFRSFFVKNDYKMVTHVGRP